MHLAAVVMVAALAQPVDELESSVDRLHASAMDVERSVEARRADALAAIERRRELIERGENHPRRGLWMIDQAGALLSRLGDDGADASVLFETDLYGQRERVRRDVAEALSMIQQAPRALEEGIRQLDRANDLAGASDLRAAERDVRLDFFDARGSLLGAALASGESRTMLATRAMRAASDLELEGGAEAARLTTMGLASLLAGEVGEAEQALSSALTLAGRGESPRAVWCEAVVGMALCQSSRGDINGAVRRLDAALGDAPVVVEDRTDAALVLVVLGVRARLLIEAGLLDDAFAAHLELLRRGLPGIDEPSSRSIVLESAAHAAAGIDDVSSLAPEIGFARAIRWSRSASMRDAAIELLGATAARDDAGSLAVDALWEQSVLLLEAGEAERAVVSLTALARRFPGAVQAGRALEAALAYGHALSARGEAEAAFDAALDLVELGRVAIERRSFWLIERAKRSLRAGELEAALTTLELVAPDDELAAEASTLFGAAVRDRLDALWLEAVAARVSGRDVGRIAEREIVPLASRAVVFARDRELGWVSQMRADLADGRTESGQAGARVLYQRLLEDEAVVTGGRVRLLLGLARSLLLAEERERAFDRLREAVGLLDDRVPDEVLERERFWHVWTLILEMLAEENPEGARSGEILANIVRLETIDPSLGGAPWRERIEAVRASTP